MARTNPITTFSCCITILVLALIVVPRPILGSDNVPHFCYEECLKQAFNLSPAPTPSAAGRVISRSTVCNDIGRSYYDSVHITGKLPLRYLQALCRVLKDEGKVEEYVQKTFTNHDLKTLFDGQDCKIVSEKPDPCSAV